MTDLLEYSTLDRLTEDFLLGGRVRLFQPADGFRVSIDAVLVAAACPAQPGDLVLDLGCGTGAVGLCLLARQPQAQVVGIDRDHRLCAIAERNVEANGRVGALRLVTMDAGLSALRAERFQHVVCNPPFHAPGRGRPSPLQPRAAAAFGARTGGLFEAAPGTPTPLRLWLAAAANALRHGGWLTVIFRADRLDDFLRAMPGALGSPQVLPLWPRRDRPARRVIIACRKGGRAPLTLLPGLVLHAETGLTAAAEAVLRDAAAIGGFGLGAMAATTGDDALLDAGGGDGRD